jgi:hypothetical protein
MISFKELGKIGRLGNQLFQIATTIALAIRNNDRYIFPTWLYENSFNLHDCFSANITNYQTYNELNFTYTPILYKPNLNLFGYFQSEKYFVDHWDDIRKLLTPTITFGTNNNCTSIHVRRGDYLNLTKKYSQLNMDYYKMAMEKTNTSKYMVFSDDIAWCKNNFQGDQFIFSEGKSDVEDLALMLGCEHNIIANSSFSWWGAYLNKNPTKIVVAPSKWFGPVLSYNDTRDLLPSSWIKI